MKKAERRKILSNSNIKEEKKPDLLGIKSEDFKKAITVLNMNDGYKEISEIAKSAQIEEAEVEQILSFFGVKLKRIDTRILMDSEISIAEKVAKLHKNEEYIKILIEVMKANEEGLSIAEITRRMDRTETGVRNYLKELGLEFNYGTDLNSEQKKLITNKYNRGKTPKEIASEMDLPIEKIEGYLRIKETVQIGKQDLDDLESIGNRVAAAISLIGERRNREALRELILIELSGGLKQFTDEERSKFNEWRDKIKQSIVKENDGELKKIVNRLIDCGIEVTAITQLLHMPYDEVAVYADEIPEQEINCLKDNSYQNSKTTSLLSKVEWTNVFKAHMDKGEFQRAAAVAEMLLKGKQFSETEIGVWTQCARSAIRSQNVKNASQRVESARIEK